MPNTKEEAGAKYDKVRQDVKDVLTRAADSTDVFERKNLETLDRLAEAVDTSWRGIHELKPSRFSAATRLTEILYERIEELNKAIDADVEVREADAEARVSSARKTLVSWAILGSMLEKT